MHHLWRARWCLTIPQGNGFSQVGLPAIYYNSTRSSFLFMVKFQIKFLLKKTKFNLVSIYFSNKSK